MKTHLAFLAIFSLLLLCSTADGRKYPEKYWGKGRILRMQMEKAELLDTSSEPVGSGGVGSGDPKENEPLVTSSEPVGSGGGGDTKEEGPLGTFYGGSQGGGRRGDPSTFYGGSQGGGGGGRGDSKEKKPCGASVAQVGRGGSDSGDDPKKKRSLLFGYRVPKVPLN